MAAAGRSTAVGVFADRGQAERAVDALERAGFSHEQIGFVRPGEEQFEGNTGVGDSDTPVEKATTTGAATGGIVGGLLGAAAALLLPGIGPIVAGGVLATALGGAAMGATAGGILGALTNLGVPEEEARRYESEFRAGRSIVTVRADGRYDEAQRILREYGA